MGQPGQDSSQDRPFRITVDLSKRERAILETLRNATGESSSNLVRFGLNLLEYLVSQSAEGANLTLMKGDRQIEIFLPFSVRASKESKKERV
jgi:hypothetical protein